MNICFFLIRSALVSYHAVLAYVVFFAVAFVGCKPRIAVFQFMWGEAKCLLEQFLKMLVIRLNVGYSCIKCAFYSAYS